MKAHIIGKQLGVKNNSQLIQGTVGEEMLVAFSDDWAGLAKTAVFSNGVISRDVIVAEDKIILPWELLTEPDCELCLGFHGAAPDGSIVKRTNVVCLGTIRPSLEPSKEEPEVPSPTRADQIQVLAELALSIAADIQGDATAGLFDGEDGFSPTISIEDIEGGHRVSITDVDGSKQFDVMDGDSGGSLSPSASPPAMDGIASAGSSAAYARGDHVHPVDTSRLAANQGTANAGCFLVVGSDGVVTPVTMQTWQGGNY